MHKLKNFKAYKEKKEEYKPTNTSEEAKICLNCPFPSCTTATTCRRFKEEMKKVQRLKYEKCGKKVNKKGVV